MWLLQFKYLSIVMPRKLNSSTRSNSDLSICKVGSYILFAFNRVRILDNS